jgi:hypothetical protein
MLECILPVCAEEQGSKLEANLRSADLCECMCQHRSSRPGAACAQHWLGDVHFCSYKCFCNLFLALKSSRWSVTFEQAREGNIQGSCTPIPCSGLGVDMCSLCHQVLERKTGFQSDHKP